MPRHQLGELLTTADKSLVGDLHRQADEVRRRVFGNKVLLRALIEVSNYCRNNCYYCGVRAGNFALPRYRLSKADIMQLCHEAHSLGLRTFVLQGAEDLSQTDAWVEDVVRDIHQAYPDSAITLSLGEKSRKAYQAFFDAGASRYLLRHETFNSDHYKALHPGTMSQQNRLQCLHNLKDIGYQVGSGFMVGSPMQTTDNVIDDLMYLHRLKPQMIGIGPFVPHHASIFAHYPAGSVSLTLRLISILRLMHPHALIPGTTALATLQPEARTRALLYGANVLMPNITPPHLRPCYQIYDNKAATGSDAAEGLKALQQELEQAGLQIDWSRGDYCNS